jgi:hypothetical protein
MTDKLPHLDNAQGQRTGGLGHSEADLDAMICAEW